MNDSNAASAVQTLLMTQQDDQDQSSNNTGATTGHTPPPFLTKTFEMVDDAGTDHIVRWSGDTSFVVTDPGKFSVTVLPCYFKHNNLSSFVRQLNIYGFRKVNSESWEFSNPSFLRGSPDRLREIKRRKTAPKEETNNIVEAHDTRQMVHPSSINSPNVQYSRIAAAAGGGGGDPNMCKRNGAPPRQENTMMNSQQSLMDEVQRLRNEQESMQRMLAATLNELHESRCHQHRTQNTVEKIMGFLTSVLQTNVASMNGINGVNPLVRKRPHYSLTQLQPSIPVTADGLAPGQTNHSGPSAQPAAATQSPNEQIGDMLLEIMSMEELPPPPATNPSTTGHMAPPPANMAPPPAHMAPPPAHMAPPPMSTPPDGPMQQSPMTTQMYMQANNLAARPDTGPVNDAYAPMAGDTVPIHTHQRPHSQLHPHMRLQ